MRCAHLSPRSGTDLHSVQLRDMAPGRAPARPRLVRIVRRISSGGQCGGADDVIAVTGAGMWCRMWPRASRAPCRLRPCTESASVVQSTAADPARSVPFTRDELKDFIRSCCEKATPASRCVASPHTRTHLGRLVVKEPIAKQFGIRTVTSDAEREPDPRKRRFDADDNDVERRKRERRYPCEDLYLTPDERSGEAGAAHAHTLANTAQAPRPPADTELGMPQACVGDALVVWDFCHAWRWWCVRVCWGDACSDALRLSKFSWAQFAEALTDASQPRLPDLLQHSTCTLHCKCTLMSGRCAALHALLRMLEPPRIRRVDDETLAGMSAGQRAHLDRINEQVHHTRVLLTAQSCQHQTRAALRLKLSLAAAEDVARARLAIDPGPPRTHAPSVP